MNNFCNDVIPKLKHDMHNQVTKHCNRENKIVDLLGLYIKRGDCNFPSTIFLFWCGGL